MPSVPEIYGIAPRFEQENAILKFILLLLILMTGLLLGKVVANTFNKSERKIGNELTHVKRFAGIAALALLLALVGEAFYIRNIIFDRSLLQSALDESGVAVIGEAAREDSITGLTSLVNLFMIPVAVYGIFAIGRIYPLKVRRKYAKYLTVLGVFVALHSLLLAARMFLVYFVLILFSIYLLEYRPHSRRFVRWVVLGIGLGILIIVGGELLRYGWQMSQRSGEPVLSAPILVATVQYLVQAYIASDMNNAFILLNAEPSYQIVSSAHLISMVASSLFGMEYYEFSSVPYWTSRYGTVNVLGQWWFDLGWLSIIWALLIGMVLGALYQTVYRRTQLRASYTTLLYLFCFPGFFALSRLNYYGLSIFVLPSFFLFLAYVFVELIHRSSDGERGSGV